MMFTLVALLLTFLVFINAHSWVEDLRVIDENGYYIGQSGYPRGYVDRTNPSFTDKAMTYLLPPSGRQRLDYGDPVCSQSQNSRLQQTQGYPKLAVAPGDNIALRYLENGHVTLPDLSARRSTPSGHVSVFGSVEDSANHVLDVLQWDPVSDDNATGLLTTQDFDDGRCYQINQGSISTLRQQQFPNPSPEAPESKHELWCESNVKIPEIVPIGSVYTIYWIWNWSTNETVENGGKEEYYTTCCDVDVRSRESIDYRNTAYNSRNPQVKAVKDYLLRAQSS